MLHALSAQMQPRVRSTDTGTGTVAAREAEGQSARQRRLPAWAVRCASLPASQLSVLTADKASQSLGVQLSLAHHPRLPLSSSPYHRSLCARLPSHPSAPASPTRYRPAQTTLPAASLACFALPGALDLGPHLSAIAHKGPGPIQTLGLSSSRPQ